MRHRWAEIVVTCLRAHPPECVFAPGAAQRITAKMEGLGGDYTDVGAIDALKEAIEAEEIYCPHEGIDRRAEFGYPHPTTQGWVEWASHREAMI